MARPTGVSFTSSIAFILSAAVLHLKLYRLYYSTGNTVFGVFFIICGALPSKRKSHLWCALRHCDSRTLK